LGILKEVHEFCQKHHLKYSLAYGTMLGAVRHKGFIPWDDDIDIIMPRRDYDVLISSFNSETHIQNLQLISHDIDSRYYLPFAKVVNRDTDVKENVNSNFHIGIFVDVFALDNMSDDEVKGADLYRQVKRYGNLLTMKNLVRDKNRSWSKNLLIRLFHCCLSVIPRTMIIRHIDKLIRKYAGPTMTQYVGNIYPGNYGKKEIMPSSWWDNVMEVDFEEYKFNVSKEYHKILSNLYGNYMQLPPENKRVTHHGFKAFWK
jgi:lipopolysaccharide cholinephosphotransferase